MSSTPSAWRRPVLLDTNVLINAIDDREQDKSRVASELIERAIDAGIGTVSPQILAEYFDVTTRPKGTQPPILTIAEATRAVEGLLASCRCLDLTPITVYEAVRAATRYQMRIFDAHVWAAARLNGIETIISEDAQSQPVIEGVRFINPFAAGFLLEHIGL